MQHDTELGATLLLHARAALAAHLYPDRQSLPLAQHDALRLKGASFVTLTCDDALRGCIGSVRAQRPLGEDVARNAVAAASRDPRFPPLPAGELDAIRIEVSVLSDPQLLDDAGEKALLGVLRPGVDGVILHAGCRSATFLPQVWETLPAPAQFLAELKRKAGLAPDVPRDDLLFATFSVSKWRE